jgi:hypothetical protein
MSINRRLKREEGRKANQPLPHVAKYGYLLSALRAMCQRNEIAPDSAPLFLAHEFLSQHCTTPEEIQTVAAMKELLTTKANV